MNQLDRDILLAIATIIAAFIAGMLGFLAQWRIIKLENSLSEKKEKQGQKLKYYIPLLRSLYELDDRLERIIKNLDTDWLDKEQLEKIKKNEGFALTPNNTGYFIISSIYLIARFFGVTETIKKGVDTTKLSKDRSKIRSWGHKIKVRIYKYFKINHKKGIFQFDPDITKVCRLFQYEEIFKTYLTSKKLTNPVDACKLHKHIQNSIGEMMLEKDGNNKHKVKSFREFYDAFVSDPKFRFWFVPIENLFIDLSKFEKDKDLEVQVEMKNDIRPLRLITIQYWCRVLMERISEELNLEDLNLQTRPTEDVLKGLTPELINIIKNYKLDISDTYLLGLRVNND